MLTNQKVRKSCLLRLKKDHCLDLFSAEREEMSQLEALLKKQQENEQKKPELCACWCTGWAEVKINFDTK